MANIQQIKLDNNNFVTEFYVLQELLPDFIQVEVTPQTGSVNGRKYDPETNTFLDEWLEGYEPQEPEQTQLDRIEANTATILGNESALDVLLGVE